MNFEVKEIEYCKKSVQATADVEKINSKRSDVALEFKDAKMSGFRPGKASLDIIKIRFKKEIEERLKQRLAEDAYHEACDKNGIKPLGQPRFTQVNLNPNKFECSFVVSTQPEFELTQYKEFDIPAAPQEMTVNDLAEKIMQQVRVQNGQSMPYGDDDFAQMGDQVIVNYTVSVDGQPHPDLTGENEVITVGNSPFRHFDDEILGMVVGDERKFTVIGPENSPEQYRGKSLDFDVKLVMGAKQIPAPLDEELAKKLQFESLDTMRAAVVEMASSRVKDYEAQHLMNQVALRLRDLYTFRIPDFLLTAEAQYQAGQSKKDWATISDEEKETFLKKADASVRLTMILAKVRETDPEAQLTDEEVVQLVRDNVAKLIQEQGSNQDVDTVLKTMSQQGMLPMLVGRIRDEHALNWIVKTCNVQE